MVEILPRLASLPPYLPIGVKTDVALVWALIAVLLSLAFIYHDLGVIPDRLVFPAALCGLAASIGLDPLHWWYYLAGCAGAGVMALLLSVLSPGATTFSQAKIALLLGAVFGPWALAAVPAAVLLRTIAGITLVFGRKGRLRARTVFAPYVSDPDVRQDVEAVHTHDSKADAEVMTWL
jgi:prepilin signal peptidase PulO-like enzyme (type II secretory pathway)